MTSSRVSSCHAGQIADSLDLKIQILGEHTVIRYFMQSNPTTILCDVLKKS
jgi:hypothetical protein